MKHISSIIFMALSVFSVFGIEQRVLNHAVVPLVRPDNVWDLSNLADGFGECEYRVYGDSLISEEHDGVRVWYDTGRNGLVRIETLLWRTDPDSIVDAARWNSHLSDKLSAFKSIRFRESLPSDSIIGTLERSADESGILVLPDHDSIPVIMTTELLTANDYRRSVTRWFATKPSEKCRLPLAMSITAGYPEEDPATMTYIVDGDVIRNEADFMPDLEVIEVSRAGNLLTITSPVTFTEAVRIDITDLSGISVMSGNLNPGQTTIELDLSTLPAGYWMAVLSTPGVEPRKIRL